MTQVRFLADGCTAGLDMFERPFDLVVPLSDLKDGEK